MVSDHFSIAPRYAQYRSSVIQNDLILCCGEWIKKQLTKEVKKARYFSVCADEAADSANKEQLPLVIRFVDESCTIREEFFEFIFYVIPVCLGKHCPKNSLRQCLSMA